MKIAFICSSLEADRDGVGDYTRFLAKACFSAGSPCCVIALNDRYCREAEESELAVELQEGTLAGQKAAIPVLRLPVGMPWPERVKWAREFRDRFQPEWISVQFVPYGFNKKGIPWRLSGSIRQIAEGCRLHVMFHELWVGVGRHSPLKHRVVGTIQRAVVLRLIRVLRPRVIHTSIPHYVELLRAGDVRAGLLPLFGNIPVAPQGGDAWFSDKLQSADCDIRSDKRGRFWLAGFFGSIYEGWTPEPFFGVLREAAQRANKRVCFIAAGRSGTAGMARWNAMVHQYGDTFSFVNLGELSTERVSQFFQTIDFGIATTPWRLIGKSGAAAAMADHGLPIIVTRGLEENHGCDVAGPALQSMLEPCDATLQSRLESGLPKRAPMHRVSEIARQFAADLRSSEEA